MPLRLSKHRVLLDGIPLNESQSSSLPSASTLDIWAVSGNIIPISGTATITGFTAAPQAGTRRTLLCTGTPTFTHSSNLLLPGSANYTATAGDRIEVLAVTTTQFRLSVIKASVLPDVQFSKDGSGNVTGIADPVSGVHATLGKNVITVGAGGRYATLQAAVDSLTTSECFVPFTPIAGWPTVGTWPTGFAQISVGNTAIPFSMDPNTADLGNVWIKLGADTRLYPLEAITGSSTSDKLYTKYPRIEELDAVSQPIYYFREVPKTIILLDRGPFNVSIVSPVSVDIKALARAEISGLQSVEGLEYFSLSVGNSIVVTTSAFGFTQKIIPCLGVLYFREGCTLAGWGSDGQYMEGLGTVYMDGCHMSMQINHGLSHNVIYNLSGDLVINNITVEFIGMDTGTSPLGIGWLFWGYARNLTADGIKVLLNDPQNKIQRAWLFTGSFNDSYGSMSISNVSMSSKYVNSSCTLSIVEEDTSNNGAGPAVTYGGSLSLSNISYDSARLTDGAKRIAFKTVAAGSNRIVTASGIKNCTIQVPTTGSYTRSDNAGGAIAVAYVATVTPNANVAEVHTIGTLTGNLTIAAPTNPQTGQRLTLNYAQNATGSWTITYNAVFKTTAPAVGGANQKGSHSFVYDGTNWVQSGGALVWL